MLWTLKMQWIISWLLLNAPNFAMYTAYYYYISILAPLSNIHYHSYQRIIHFNHTIWQVDGPEKRERTFCLFVCSLVGCIAFHLMEALSIKITQNMLEMDIFSMTMMKLFPLTNARRMNDFVIESDADFTTNANSIIHRK